MKELTTRQIAAVKRQYQNSYPMIKKMESNNAKIAELLAENDTLEITLNAGELGIKNMTGGYRSVELIERVVTPKFNEDGSPKMDNDGKYQLKNVSLVFKAPVEVEELSNNEVDESAEAPEVEVNESNQPIPEDPFNNNGFVIPNTISE